MEVHGLQVACTIQTEASTADDDVQEGTEDGVRQVGVGGKCETEACRVRQAQVPAGITTRGVQLHVRDNTGRRMDGCTGRDVRILNTKLYLRLQEHGDLHPER